MKILVAGRDSGGGVEAVQTVVRRAVQRWARHADVLPHRSAVVTHGGRAARPPEDVSGAARRALLHHNRLLAGRAPTGARPAW
jgi:hypothetical protein